MINLWLDDMRPAPLGWYHVKTVEDAKRIILMGFVEYASLDHDLGACPDCLKGMTPDEWLDAADWESMPNCEHFGTGYTLVCWMEETGNWPINKPSVHSANPVGRDKMRVAIERHYGEP